MLDFKLYQDIPIEYYNNLFRILAENMTKISSSGNRMADDYAMWKNSVAEGIKNGRKTIVIWDDNELIGFFMYLVVGSTLKMDECQIIEAYQGKHNTFRMLFGYLFSILPQGIDTVSSYANKKNIKSNEILKHIGLKVYKETEHGYLYKGPFDNLRKWYLQVQ